MLDAPTESKPETTGRVNSPVLAAETPFFVVFNYASGSGDGRAAQAEMEQILAASGRRYEIFPIEDPKSVGRTAQRAAEAAVKTAGAVIAAGGDGTINAVVQATLPTGRPFGIIPQGTFNYTTRTHAIPLDVASATRALLDARITPTQVGLANDRVFVVNASVGLYPELLEDREEYKRRFGRYRSVALWSGLMTLLQHHRQLALEIEHDQEREIIRTPALFVGNNPLQLERVGLPEAELVGRRRLAGVVVRPVSTSALLWLALRGALGQLGGADRVRDFAFRRMVVSPRTSKSRPIKVAIDGEVHFLRPPLTFMVSPRDLMLMTPAEASPVEVR